MTRRLRPLLAPALILAAGLVGLTACAPGSTAPATPPPTTGSPSTAAPTGAPDATGTPVALTCDTLISSATVEALKKQGWSAKEREFRIGPDVMDGGLQCLWADYSSASDHGLVYGWAPLSPDLAASEQQKLVDQGWIREDSDRGVYITADPAHAFGTDEQGYGMTYLFGNGWVTVSDTKQGLVLINVPQ